MKHEKRSDGAIVLTLLFMFIAGLIVYGVLGQKNKEKEDSISQNELIIYILDQLSEKEAELKEEFPEETEEIKIALLDISEIREIYADALQKLEKGEQISEEFSKENLLKMIINNLESEKKNAENTEIYDKNIKVFQDMLENLEKK